MRIARLLCIPLVLIPSIAHAASAKSPVWHAHTTYKVQSSLGIGYTPAQIRSAYGLNGLSSGTGTAVALVDAFTAPDVGNNLNVFSKKFNLTQMNGTPGNARCTISAGPHPCLQVVSQGTARDTGWATETDLDTEWAHAAAPQADILIVSAATDALPDLIRAVDVARQSGASALSLSWGGPEFPTETSEASHFTGSAMAIVASSGDEGTGVSFPAALPSVIGVGGTRLVTNGSGGIASETAWSGSGGGVSAYISRPTFQPIKYTRRAVPDVAFNADPSTGYQVYSQGRWEVVGGTSAGAPQWAAILSVVPDKNKSQLLSTFYTHSVFRDITTGSNGQCRSFCLATIGFDTVTGLGSPIGSKLKGL